MKTHLSSLTSDNFLASEGDVDYVLKNSLGLPVSDSIEQADKERAQLLRYINLRLIAQGLPTAVQPGDSDFTEISSGLLSNYRQKVRLLDQHRCPADQRIEKAIREHFSDQGEAGSNFHLPGKAFVLDRYGIGAGTFASRQWRQVCERYCSVLPGQVTVFCTIPNMTDEQLKGHFMSSKEASRLRGDKRAVPRATFLKLYEHAMNPPASLLDLPFTSEMEQKDEHLGFVTDSSSGSS